MKKRVYYFPCWILILALLLAFSACKSDIQIISLDPNLPSTKVVPQPGDTILQRSASLAAMSLWDVILESEMAFIGTVNEIMPAQPGSYKESGAKITYTDVSIIPERYLFGSDDMNPQIVRVYLGRNGNTVILDDTEATFTVTERVLVFAKQYSSTISDSGNASPYLRVVGNIFGKFRLQDDNAIQEYTNQVEQLPRLEILVSSIKR